MKIRISQLRTLIREATGLLSEAPCVSCGNPQAYVGFNSCECPNPDCEHYSRRQAADVAPVDPHAGDYENAVIELVAGSAMSPSDFIVITGPNLHHPIEIDAPDFDDEDDPAVAYMNWLTSIAKEKGIDKITDRNAGVDEPMSLEDFTRMVGVT